MTASGYVHPSTKQCTWTPDLSNYATKADLEEVAAPKVVGSGEAILELHNDGDRTTKNIPTSDYIILNVFDPYGRLNRTITIYKGNQASFPAWDNINNEFYNMFYICKVNASGTMITFVRDDPSRDIGYSDVNWVCYK